MKQPMQSRAPSRSASSNLVKSLGIDYSQSMFLQAPPTVVDQFFIHLQSLPSPLKEEVFVISCLTEILSVRVIN